MNDLHLLAALHHITETAPDAVTAGLLTDGIVLTFTAQGAQLARDGVACATFTLGQPCARFASIPLLLHGPNLRRPILWRTIPLAALAAFEAQVAA